MVERETMEFDVLIVGAGPAGLACGIHLMDLVKAHGEPKLQPEVLVIEKGKEVGAHIFSGAVMDPKGIDELMPDWKEQGAPIEAAVSSDSMYYFTKKKARKLPITPPGLSNKGMYVVSLNKFIRWLNEKAEERGVNVFAPLPGRELIMENESVRGVRLADAGVGKNGEHKSNYEAGSEVRAKITVLAEGGRGSLTKSLVNRLDLQGKNPQVYAAGVKEVWEVPEANIEAGAVMHSLGWPLPSHVFGGAWVYGMGKGPGGGRLVSIGHVTGLDSKDATTDPHYYFQLFKTQPLLRKILKGGKMLDYGAKSLPEGGLYAMPKCHGDGFLILGDSAGFMNGMRLKGIHLALRSGMLAAKTIFEGLLSAAKDGKEIECMPEAQTARFQELFEADWSYKELYKARNFHQGFQKGRLMGLVGAAFGMLFNGKGFLWSDGLSNKQSHEYMKKLDGKPVPKQEKLPDLGELTFDKVTDVYESGTKHEEDQPCHLVITEPDICNTRCTQEYGNPCQYFCPAQVYEMLATEEGGPKELHLNPSNCVHCKTCDIADPYQVIEWVTPEGGGGPGYRLL